jgi:hypothetical protein
MILNKRIVTLGLLAALALTGCGKKEKAQLAGIHKVAIIGLTYSKNSEDENLHDATARSIELNSEIGEVVQIDGALQEYFGSIVLELRRLIELRDIDVISAEKFAENKTLANLIESQNKTIPKSVLSQVYSPKHYALSVYSHEPKNLAKLVTELGVDALLTVRLGIIKKSPQLGVQMEMMLIDKNGLPLLKKPLVIRSLSKQRFHKESPLLNPKMPYQITAENDSVLVELKASLFAEMNRTLSKN